MKKIPYFTIMLIVSILFNALNSYSQKAYEIAVQFKNLKNDTVLLGHHFSKQLIPDDTIVTDKNGYAVFKGKEKLPGGMYFIYFPDKKILDFLVDKDQKFLIEGDTADLLKHTKYSGSAENTVFLNYQKFLRDINAESMKLKNEAEKFKGNTKKDKEIKSKQVKLNEKLQFFFNKTITENPNFFFSKFLKSTKTVEIPDEIKGRENKYYYYRNHYFDYFDVSDPRLLRTPIYEGKIDNFLDKVIPQHPDTLIKEVGNLVEKSRTSEELFRYMLVHLFNKYASSHIMTSENVYVYLAMKYYIPEAKWSSPDFISDLRLKIAKKNLCLINKKCKDIDMSIVSNDSLMVKKYIKLIPEFKKKGLAVDSSKSDDKIKREEKTLLLSNFFAEFTGKQKLHDIDAEYILLWFWSPDCSHCKKETPKFHEEYIEKKYKEKGVEIISIFLNKDIDDWKKFSKITNDWLNFIKDNKLYGWTNVWNPFDHFRYGYDISSSPVLYVLDKDKKIVAKRIEYKQAFEIIDKELERKSK